MNQPSRSSLSINLLPIDVIHQKRQTDKYSKLKSLSIAAILGLVFLSSTTFALRILQSNNIKNAEISVSAAENKITEFKSTESSLTVLKNRLTAINQITSVPSKQKELYNLISSIIPPSINVNAISVDRSGNLTLSATLVSGSEVDDLISFLTTSDQSKDKIAGVDIDSLSRGRDGVYRLSLKIRAK